MWIGFQLRENQAKHMPIKCRGFTEGIKDGNKITTIVQSAITVSQACQAFTVKYLIRSIGAANVGDSQAYPATAHRLGHEVDVPAIEDIQILKHGRHPWS